MRYSRFSEDYKNINVNSSVVSVWKYPLYNNDLCVMYSPSSHDENYIRDLDVAQLISRNIFLTDESGESWSILKKSNHINYQDFKCRYHLGYIVVETMYRDVISSVILFVPREGSVECAMISVANRSGQKKKLRMFSIADICSINDSTCCTAYEKEQNLIYSYQMNSPFSENQAIPYIHTELDITGYETEYRKVYGTVADKDYPSTARLRRTSNSLVWGSKAALAVENEFFLSHEELANMSVIFGVAYHKDDVTTKIQDISLQKSEISGEINRYKNYESMNVELKKLLSIVEKSYGMMTIDHPEKEIEGFCNYWAKKVIRFIVDWGAFFNKKENYRSELLNALRGLMYFDKDTFLTKFEELALEINDSGVFGSDKYNDINDSISIMEIFIDYLKFYKEFSLFDAKKDWASRKQVSKFLFEKIININSKIGDHGLLSVLYGNEHPVYIEHTSLTFKYYYLVKEFFELAVFKGKKKFLGRLTNIAEKLRETLETRAINGDQYIFGFHSSGYLLGHAKSLYGKFFLEPNLVALKGDISVSSQKEVYGKIQRNLFTSLGYMTMMPAYKEYDPSQFYWSYLAPGISFNGGINVRENILKMEIDLLKDNEAEAFRILKRIVPTYAGKVCSADRALEEPYTIPEQLISMQHPYKEGVSGGGLMSGNSGLVLSLIIKYFIGIKAQYSGYKLEPILLNGWKYAGLNLIRNGQVFNYEVRTDDVEEDQIMCDGRLCSEENVSFGITAGSKVKLVIKEK